MIEKVPIDIRSPNDDAMGVRILSGFMFSRKAKMTSIEIREPRIMDEIQPVATELAMSNESLKKGLFSGCN